MKRRLLNTRTITIGLIIALAIVLALVAAQIASRHNTGAAGSPETVTVTAPRTDAYPLHAAAPGVAPSRGPRVAGLQWMLGGHAPSHFKGIHPYSGTANGYFGLHTKEAVRSAKRELGYPLDKINGAAGLTMVRYLKGEVARPRAYVVTAYARKRALDAETAAAVARSTMRTRIVSLARRYIGVQEYPLGSNCGHQVGIFQSATYAYCAAWCMSFVQYILKTAGYGTIAYHSAHVFTVKQYGVIRGWGAAPARSTSIPAWAGSQRPAVGRLVVFNSWQGHVGIVSLVTSGGFWSIEGNSGDRVVSRFHATGTRSTTMLQLPGVA